mgnify:CR=1 FL=1
MGLKPATNPDVEAASIELSIDGKTVTAKDGVSLYDVISMTGKVIPAMCYHYTFDPFGNRIHHFGLHELHDSLTVNATSLVECAEQARPVDPTPWEEVVRQLDGARDDLALDAGFFRSATSIVDLPGLGTRLHELAEPSFGPGVGVVEAIDDLCHRIHDGFAFDAGFTEVSTPLRDVLAARRGVCQDFAHLMIGCLRTVGLAARYVSGYIETVPPPGQERLVGADASHAWCSVWTPMAGWVDLDPTNGLMPADRHVTVAWGRDYADVTPVRGVVIGPATTQRLEVSVDVERVA